MPRRNRTNRPITVPGSTVRARLMDWTRPRLALIVLLLTVLVTLMLNPFRQGIVGAQIEPPARSFVFEVGGKLLELLPDGDLVMSGVQLDLPLFCQMSSVSSVSADGRGFFLTFEDAMASPGEATPGDASGIPGPGPPPGDDVYYGPAGDGESCAGLITRDSLPLWRILEGGDGSDCDGRFVLPVVLESFQID